MVRLIADVQNHGPGAVIRPFRIEFAYRSLDPEADSDFIVFATVPMPGLEAGQETAAKAELDTTGLVPGVYELRVRVDPDRSIPEVHDTNNELFTRLEVLPAGVVDLKVDSLELKPSIPLRGQIVKVKAVILNAGEVAVGPFQVGFFYRPSTQQREVPFANVTVLRLKPGERQTVIAELDTEELSPGDYRIIVRADPQNQIQEADKTNNEMSAGLTVL